MNWKPVLMIGVVLGYVGFEVSAIRRAQHLFEPLHTLDEFASMHHASQACGDADPDRLERFARNFTAVRRRAERDLAQARPDRSPQEIAQQVSQREAARARRVEDLVRTGGCGDPEIRTYLQLHRQRARLRIRTGS